MISRFKNHAHPARLLMPHGNPDDLQAIDQPNWSRTRNAVPLAVYREVGQRDELNRTISPHPLG